MYTIKKIKSIIKEEIIKAINEIEQSQITFKIAEIDKKIAALQAEKEKIQKQALNK